MYCEVVYDLLQGMIFGILNNLENDFAEKDKNIPGWANILQGATSIIDLFILKGTSTKSATSERYGPLFWTRCVYSWPPLLN